MPRLLFALLPVLVLLSACEMDASPEAEGDAAVADAATIATSMERRYEANVGAVEAFTVLAGGAEARYELAVDSTGMDRFGPPQVAAAGDGEVDPASAQLLYVQIPNVPRLSRGLRTADVRGPISRDGRSVYVFTTSDPGVMVGEPGSVADDGSASREFRVYVGAEDFDIFEIYQSASADTMGAVTSRLIYSDFRDTDGLTLPFSVRQIETGLNAGISDDERLILGGRLGLALKQAEAMPPGPDRDAQLAELRAQQRLIGEGVAEAMLAVDEVRVGKAE